MSDEIRVIIRPGNKSDLKFIEWSWMHGVRYGNSIPEEFKQMPSWWERIPGEIYYTNMPRAIASILFRPNTVVEVAGEEKDRLWTAGFVVYEGDTLHWIFVKPEYRGKGIANLLLKDKDIKKISFTTKPGHALMQKRGWTFNPFLGGIYGTKVQNAD